MKTANHVDPSEAPNGYYAVLKSSVVTAKLGNICRACDWRSECQKTDTDFGCSSHRCMDYPVVLASDGRTISRNDGCSVVFKAKQPKR